MESNPALKWRTPLPQTFARPYTMHGVTLIETMCVVALIGILTAATLPSLQGTLSRSHSTVVGNRLLADLARARSEAIMTGLPSVICPSNDGSTCSGTDSWSNGWIVFVDRDGSDKRLANEPILSVVGKSDLGGLLVITSVDRTKMRFLPDGKSGGTNETMHVCDGAKLTRSVVTNISGRSRLEQPANANTPCGAVATQ
jgi:type IV fimbrial biogenesis protein FimT